MGTADLSKRYDVLVIGGGNAALCAAISARREGRSVLVLEAAPHFYRGGNTRHTRNMRCAHDTATGTLTGPYTEDEFFEDLLRVTNGNTDENLARMMIRQSKDMLGWIVEQGVRFQPSLGGTLSLGRTNSFFLGGGRAMLNALYRTAETLGVDVLYDAEVTALDIEDGTFLGATVGGKVNAQVRAGALIAASGGFEANIEWLKQGWGEIADNFLIRGTPYNRGSILRMLMDAGAQTVGDPTQCHAVAIDARAHPHRAGLAAHHGRFRRLQRSMGRLGRARQHAHAVLRQGRDEQSILPGRDSRDGGALTPARDRTPWQRPTCLGITTYW